MAIRSSVLILTQPEDSHAYAVAEALNRKGVTVSLWHTSNFPGRDCESISFSAGKTTLHIDGIAVRRSVRPFKTVWHRRPCLVLPADRVHPADRKFAETECTAFRRALFSLLAPGALWVNAPDAAWRASRKPLQLEVAIRVGFTVPETLVSNDPRRIRRFLAAQDGALIYKPFAGATWRQGDTQWMPFASRVTAEDLVEDHLLQAVAGIYQEVVPKAYELRVTVMGRQAVAVKIRSQETIAGRIDWRRSYDELKMEPFALAPEITARCVNLLREFGLAFGCIDLIVRPDGDTVFLEVNESGQFLFLERYAPVPLLDTFADFLAAGDPDFLSSGCAPGIRYEDVAAEVEAMMRDAKARHIPVPETVVSEEDSSPFPPS
jgi:glutathione synthase/RimK-type ligase-like ATP-grasp enzyme